MTRDALESRYRLFRRLTVVLGAACAFLVVVVAGQLAMSGGDDPAPPAAGEETPSAEEGTAGYADSQVVRRDPEDPLAIGDVDAPIVLTEWTDLRCPFCAAFGRDTMPELVEEYVDEGLVRIEVHDVAFFGEQSEDASVAARAAGEQGRFFAYLDAVYEAAPSSGHPDLERDDLVAFAEKAGVPDIARFEADLDDDELRQAAQRSTATAQQLGVNSVPFFVLGDQALSGAQPVEVFRQYLDEALEKAE